METRPIDADDVAAVYDDLRAHHDASASGGESGIHHGFYDEDHDDRASAVENTNRVLADAVDVGSDDRVLCLGCGAGDDAAWLAAKRGATVVGVDVSEAQVHLAREHARRRDVETRTSFCEADFHDLSAFDDGSFDVVWALEAFCHSGNDPSVLEQARRVLADGGRLVVADLFQLPRKLSESERTTLRSAHDAFGARCNPIDEFVGSVHDLGFVDVEIRDVTESILPSSRRRGLYGRIAYLPYRLLSRLGLANERRADVLQGSRKLHDLVTSEALGYYVVTAQR